MKTIVCNVLVGLFLPGAAFAAEAAQRDDAWWSLLVPVIAVTMAMLAMLWWLRRGKTLGGNGPLKVVQAVAVGARERIVVIDVQGRRLVVGVTPSKIELLSELHAATEPTNS